MKTTLRSTLTFSLFTALVSLGLASCSKEEAPAPTAPTAAATSADAVGENILRTDERLTAFGFLRSPNGRFQLVMQGDGNLVSSRVSNGSAVWTSGTAGNPGAFCTVQRDGNFVVYAANGRPLYATGPQTGPRTDNYLTIENNGVVILHIPSQNRLIRLLPSLPFPYPPRV